MIALYIINVYSKRRFELKSFIKEIIYNKMKCNNQYIYGIIIFTLN